MKTCKKCRGEFPEDNFPKTVSKYGKAYTKPYCISCNREINNAQYQKKKLKGEVKEEFYYEERFTFGGRKCF